MALDFTIPSDEKANLAVGKVMAAIRGARILSDVGN